MHSISIEDAHKYKLWYSFVIIGSKTLVRSVTFSKQGNRRKDDSLKFTFPKSERDKMR